MTKAKRKQMDDRVIEILLKHPETKDNDNELVARYWYEEHRGFFSNNDEAMKVLRMLANGAFPSHDSITRTRRKAQEHNEALRGSQYNARHDKAEDIRTTVPHQTRMNIS